MLQQSTHPLDKVVVWKPKQLHSVQLAPVKTGSRYNKPQRTAAVLRVTAKQRKQLLR